MEKRISRYTSFILKYSPLIILLSLLLSVIGFLGVIRLDLKSDFSSLLPQDYESVKLLKEISRKVGGLGMLNIGIETDDLTAGKRFVEDISLVIREELSDEIKTIDYSAREVKEHYEKYGLLYLSEEDLKRLKHELKDWIERKKLELSPFYFSLEEEEDLRFEDLKQRYVKFLSKYESYIDGYYTGENGRLLVIFLKPRYTPTDISISRRLIKRVEETVKELNPLSYHHSMKVGLAGNYKIAVEEYDAVRRDIGSTFLLCVILVSSVIFLFFRRIRVIFFLTITLTIGIIISFGILSLFVKEIVVMTGFLGSIVMGTGINYGIIQLARFFEERMNNEPLPVAIDIAIHKTLIPTAASAFTTAAGFFALSFAITRSFKEFGLLGSLGIVICWLLTYFFLPALLYTSERIKPSEVFLSGFRKPMFFLSSRVSDRIAYYYKPVLLFFIPLILISWISFVRYLPRVLEYDFNRLRSKMSIRSGTAVLDERISRVLKRSSTPAVIPVKDSEEAKEVCDALRNDSKHLEGKIGRCVNIYSVFPENQQRKIKIIKEIYDLIKNIEEDWLDDEKREELRRFKKLFEEVHPITLKDLPEILVRQFSDTEGNIGTLVYVEPYPGKNLWESKNLFNFTESLRTISLPSGKVIKTSGEAIIFADILKSIHRDAPLTSLLALFFIISCIILLFGGATDTFYITASLIGAVSVLLGIISIFNLKINFLNFVAIPTAMGTGVDYAINIYQRSRLDGKKGMGYVLHKAGSAVLLCSLTTIIGYFTLITADTRILASYGEIAIIGEFACLLFALFFLPALLRWIKKLPA